MGFNFYWPVKFVFGLGKLNKTGEEAALLGKKALLVTGMGSARETGVLERLVACLEKSGIEIVLYEGISPNPRASRVDSAGNLARESRCDIIVGLGGGSVMDAAKAAAVSASHPGSVWEYMNSFSKYRDVTEKTVPIIEIPTVSGTGSEGNGTAVISNSKTLEKSYIKSDHLFPACSVIDPELTFTTPPRVTASSGADIVCHVLEPYINGAKPFEPTLLMTEALIKNVVSELGKALENGENASARSSLAWVSTLCCSPFRGLGLEGIGSLHHMEHSLSGRFDVSHGEGLCALLPSWLEFMNNLAPERVERFGLNVFGKKDTVQAVRQWLDSIGMKLSLGSLGIEENAVNLLAADTIRVYAKEKDFIPNGQFKLYASDMEKIYRKAF